MYVMNASIILFGVQNIDVRNCTGVYVNGLVN